MFSLDPMTAIKELDKNIAKTIESILVRIDAMEKLLAKVDL